jgi:replicative DNA helicase
VTTSKQQPRKQTPIDPVDRKLPQNVDAERAILGAVIINNAYLDAAAEIVRPDDFFHDYHRRIFSSFLLMQAEGKAMDLVSIAEKLNQLGELEASGGSAYIAQLMDGVPHVSNVAHYARIVKEKSQLRSVIHAGHAFQEKSFQSGEPKEVVNDIEKYLQTFYDQEESDAAAPVSMADAVQETWPVFDRAFNVKPGESSMMGTPTGYKETDEVLAGWIPGDLVILGARPSVGKSALLLEYLRRQAKVGNGVLFFSLEMSRASLVMRLCCLEAEVDSHSVRVGKSSDQDKKKIIAALNVMSQWPIWISEPTRMWSYDLVRRVRSFSARHQVKLVMVDYLQLLRAKAENRQIEVGKVAQDLKEAARIVGKQSGGTVIAAAQLSRLAPDERPRLDSLRESGEL